MYDIAVKMLLADRRKLVTALVGVAFSIVLMNFQGGLFIGLIRKASLLVDNSDADLWIGHKKIHSVDFSKDVPRRWLQQIKCQPGVRAASEYIVGYQHMALPDGGFEMVIVVGVDTDTLLGNAWNIHKGDASNIRRPRSIIVDVHDQDKIGTVDVGDTREIGGVRANVVAMSEGILGFTVTPYVFASIEDATIMVGRSPDDCSYFLVDVADGHNVKAVQNLLKAAIPHAAIYTREEYSWRSISFWLTRTGIGVSFGLATIIGLLVGLIVVGQSLYSSVIDRIEDYGTLVALGAKRAQLLWLLILQACILATAGITIGLITVFVLQLVFSVPRAPIEVPWYLSLSSCCLTFASCLLCATIPYGKLRRLDPAMIV